MFVGGLLYTRTILYEPVWVQRDMVLKERWSDLNLSALCAALGTSALTAYLYGDANIAYVSYTTVVVGMITFCAVQMFETDFAVRRADRFALNDTLLTVLLLGLGLFYFLGYEKADLTGFIVFLIGCLAIGFLFNSIGESDIRALIISSLSVIVIAGIEILQLVFIGFLIFALWYLAILVVRKRSLKAITAKTSFPAVPMILFPALFVLVSYPVLI